MSYMCIYIHSIHIYLIHHEFIMNYPQTIMSSSLMEMRHSEPLPLTCPTGLDPATIL